METIKYSTVNHHTAHTRTTYLRINFEETNPFLQTEPAQFSKNQNPIKLKTHEEIRNTSISVARPSLESNKYTSDLFFLLADKIKLDHQR